MFRRNRHVPVLAAAFAADVRAHCREQGITQAELAGALGVAPGHLSNMMTGTDPLTVHVLAAFIDLSRQRRTLGELAGIGGGAFVPRPAGEDIERGSLRRVIAENADLVGATCDSAQDGRITRDEAEVIRQEGMEAIVAVYQLMEETSSRTATPTRARTLAEATR